MTLSLPRYRSVTELPNPAYLENWRVSLIRPITRTNLVTNPSAETATTGYTAVGGSIARSTTESYHGAYSIAATPTAATTDGVYYGTISLTSGTTYAASVKIKVPNAAGRKYRLAFATTGATMLQTTEFVATGYWQWIPCLYTETSTTTRRVYITKNGGTETSVFYVDGLQVEACESGNQFATTYIDGDQRGLLGDLESSPAYYWTGTPHASTSVRGAQTRAGGQVVKLQNYGFFVTAIIGLGMAPVIPITTSFGQLDGSQFLNQRNDSRSFTINGRWQASTARQQDRQMAQLSADLNRDYIATRQPLTLLFEPMVDNRPIRAPIAVPGVSYIGGLEGNVDGLPTADTPISFTQYLPVISGGEDGIALTAYATATQNYIIQRSPAGQWAAMGTGMTGTDVRALIYGLDGTLYAAGNFTDAGGSGADFIAQWNGSTWSVLGSATALNAAVVWPNALAINAAGLLYVGGSFTNASGIAAADFIATWDGSAWAAVGTGTNGEVDAIAVANDGTVYVAGDFTTAGGSAFVRIAKWTGAAWAAVGSGVGANARVLAIAIADNGDIYIGGQFTTVDGVAATNIAKFNGTTWSAVGNGDGDVRTLVFGRDKILYAAGAFQTIGGVAARGVAQYNGVAWAPLGISTSNAGLNIVSDHQGGFYLTGNFSTAGGVAVNSGFAHWNGATWEPLDITAAGTPGTLQVYGVLVAPDGTLTISGIAAGTPNVAGVTSVTTTSSMAVYPTFRITSGVGGFFLYTIRNTTTGKELFFNNFPILPSEIITLTLEPSRISMVSNVRGNIIRYMISGSDVTNFALQPGANTITVLASASVADITMSWPVTLDTITDGWTK